MIAVLVVNFLVLYSLVIALYLKNKKVTDASSRKKEYDNALETLDEEMGEWFVRFIIERELANIYKHYTLTNYRDMKKQSRRVEYSDSGDSGDSDESEFESGDSDESEFESESESGSEFESESGSGESGSEFESESGGESGDSCDNLFDDMCGDEEQFSEGDDKPKKVFDCDLDPELTKKIYMLMKMQHQLYCKAFN